MANYVVEWVPDDKSGSVGADSPELPVVPSIPHVMNEGKVGRQAEDRGRPVPTVQGTRDTGHHVRQSYPSGSPALS